MGMYAFYHLMKLNNPHFTNLASNMEYAKNLMLSENLLNKFHSRYPPFP